MANFARLPNSLNNPKYGDCVIAPSYSSIEKARRGAILYSFQFVILPSLFLSLKIGELGFFANKIATHQPGPHTMCK